MYQLYIKNIDLNLNKNVENNINESFSLYIKKKYIYILFFNVKFIKINIDVSNGG